MYFCRIYIPFQEDTDSVALNIGGAFVNAFILLGLVIVLTFVLICLYKNRCYKVSAFIVNIVFLKIKSLKKKKKN